MGRRFGGLILDFVGVPTSNMVEVIDLFEVRERLPAGRVGPELRGSLAVPRASVTDS
jgi:hypothetical protein